MTAKDAKVSKPGGRARPKSSYHLVWKTVDVQGRAAQYGVAGQGLTVLFLHGWGLDHRAYKRALRRLVESGVRVLAPAMPGFGGTDHLPADSADIRSYATWASDFLDTMSVTEPVMVMGHSFGGGVGIVLAHEHPQQVSSLVLINSIGASAWTGSGSSLRSMAQRPLWDWGVHFPVDLWPLGQARKVLPVLLTEGLGNLVRDPQTFWRVAGIARRADLIAALEALKQRNLPVVVLWGNRDRIITRAAFDEMCSILEQAHVVTVEGSHSWLIADPEAFGEVMTNVVQVAERARVLGGAEPGAEVTSLVPPARRSRARKAGRDTAS